MGLTGFPGFTGRDVMLPPGAARQIIVKDPGQGAAVVHGVVAGFERMLLVGLASALVGRHVREWSAGGPQFHGTILGIASGQSGAFWRFPMGWELGRNQPAGKQPTSCQDRSQHAADRKLAHQSSLLHL